MTGPIALCAAALVLMGAAALVPTVPTAEGPPPGYSGGFGEPTCAACHVGNDVNAFDGRVTLEGLPSRYEPGASYPLTVVLEAEGTAVAGFQITARHADGTARGVNAGRLEPAEPRVAVTDSAGVSYAHQSREGSVPGSGDRASWTVVWVAPAGGSVAFHVAANSGNADNSPLSDLVYTTEIVVPPGG
jgi:hypothetical protein